MKWLLLLPIALMLMPGCATPNHFIGKWVADANGRQVDWRKCEFTASTVQCEDPERGSSDGGGYDLKDATTADVRNIWVFTLRPDGNLDFYDGNGTLMMRRAN